MDKEVLISFENFGFQYTTQAEPTLYDINLQIHRGEKILIAGPSGCGKSTLAHCINGLNPASYPGKITGSLKVKGQDAQKLGLFGLSKTVGTVLQDSDGQFIGLTVAEDIAFALENDCVPTEELHSGACGCGKSSAPCAPRDLRRSEAASQSCRRNGQSGRRPPV